MDEYDEMYGIEDEYDQQFADELEVLAEMDNGELTDMLFRKRNLIALFYYFILTFDVRSFCNCAFYQVSLFCFYSDNNNCICIELL